jgi:hypothetical protein
MRTAAIIFFFPLLLGAQDFGYSYYTITDFRSLGISYTLQDFRRAGSNPLDDSAAIRFGTNLPMIEYREIGARVAVGYQSYALRGKNVNAFSVYMESGNDFALSGRDQRNGFFIPVKLSANYIRAENTTPGQKNFDIGSLGIGTGGKYRALTRTFGLQAFGTATIHYSSVGFGTEYGSQFSLSGEIQCLLPELLFEGIIVGYRYERQQWDMSNSILNYQRFYHGPFIGIFF